MKNLDGVEEPKEWHSYCLRCHVYFPEDGSFRAHAPECFPEYYGGEKT